MGQSAEFGKFLKAMRSRITPEMAGLPSSPASRRVPGLRREEVARLADVSTDYYTRLEQGRNIHPSRAVLGSVGRALNLDPGEQAHMIALLENCANSRPSNPAQTVRPALHQLLDAVGNVPALILGRRTDVLAGNGLAFLLFADFPAMPAAERNLTRWIRGHGNSSGSGKQSPPKQLEACAPISDVTPTTPKPTSSSANSQYKANTSVAGGPDTAWPLHPQALCDSTTRL
jgi:hypothetical protein